jgi:hypothetical protein
MRAAVLTGLLVLTAPAVNANPFALPDNQPPRLTLPSQDAFAGRYAQARAKADSALLDDETGRLHYTPSAGGFGIGPIRADGADADGLGRRHGPKPHYRLDGVSVLGGSVGGSVDGRGAMLSLHWGGNN